VVSTIGTSSITRRTVDSPQAMPAEGRTVCVDCQRSAY
jgi:hypothetical protein